MRIRALRVAETGCFLKPVAIEGLSGGLDVLAGPNELGKSTLLRALGALLLENHKGANKTLKDLMPYDGGAPLVEADLEIAGALWRIRKRFLQGKAAELRELSGSRLARGADAEGMLAGLLGEDAAGLRLLWIGQQEGLEPLEPDTAQATSLRALIAREVRDATGGRAAEAVLGSVTADLARLLTPATGKPVQGGPLKQAIDDCTRLEAALTDARQALAEAEGRLERLAVARLRRQELSDPFVATRLAGEAASARGHVEAAREADERARLAQSEWQRLEGERKSAAEALHRRERHGADSERLAREIEAGTAEAAAARLVLDDCETAAGAATERLASARAGEERLRTRLASAYAVRDRARAVGEHAALERRLADASRLGGDIATLRHEIGRAAVTDVLIKRIAAEERDILRLRSRLEAAATRVVFEIEQSGLARVRVGGVSVRDGQSLTASAPLSIEIEGIGRIRLEPGASGERRSDAADLSAHETTLAELLARTGAADAQGAAALLEARRAAEARLRDAEVRLAALLPEGEAASAARHAALAAEIARTTAEEGESADVLETELAAAQKERTDAERHLLHCRDRLAEARVRLHGIATATEERRKRLAALHAELAAAPAPEPLAARLAEATAAANEARRGLDAWRERIAAPEARSELARRLDSALAAEARLAGDIAANEREIASLGGALERDQEADLHARLVRLEGEIARARARRERHQRAADELTLIKAAFSAVRAESRTDTVAPVLKAVEPYLRLVLPGAALDLDQRFAVGGVSRKAAPEAVARLSDGTREQIAVLVRLGFARLLAQAGKPAPLILDDALVYSDDGRIARAFEALRLASSLHQVIVLTCRTRAFEALGGCRLELVPWTP